MNLKFTCPECKGSVELEMTDAEAESIRERIKQHGRSPTLIVICENGHELLVTLYNTPDGLGVRDVVIPMRAKDDAGKPMSDIDWVSRTFGGE